MVVVCRCLNGKSTRAADGRSSDPSGHDGTCGGSSCSGAARGSVAAGCVRVSAVAAGGCAATAGLSAPAGAVSFSVAGGALDPVGDGPGLQEPLCRLLAVLASGAVAASGGRRRCVGHLGLIGIVSVFTRLVINLGKCLCSQKRTVQPWLVSTVFK